MTEEHRKVLNSILEPLRTLGSSHAFEIRGHTDSRKIRSKKYPSNWHLSTARALTILEEFIELGFDESKLEAKGLASFSPLLPEVDQNGRLLRQNQALNRRVEIIIQ